MSSWVMPSYGSFNNSTTTFSDAPDYSANQTDATGTVVPISANTTTTVIADNNDTYLADKQITATTDAAIQASRDAAAIAAEKERTAQLTGFYDVAKTSITEGTKVAADATAGVNTRTAIRSDADVKIQDSNNSMYTQFMKGFVDMNKDNVNAKKTTTLPTKQPSEEPESSFELGEILMWFGIVIVLCIIGYVGYEYLFNTPTNEEIYTDTSEETADGEPKNENSVQSGGINYANVLSMSNNLG